MKRCEITLPRQRQYWEDCDDEIAIYDADQRQYWRDAEIEFADGWRYFCAGGCTSSLLRVAARREWLWTVPDANTPGTDLRVTSEFRDGYEAAAGHAHPRVEDAAAMAAAYRLEGEEY